jgi:hypothetical protein
VRVRIASLVIVAMLAVPGVAVAQAPGNGGADEYIETLPGAGGNTPSNQGGGGSGGGESGAPTASGPLTPAQVAALEAQDEDGAAAASVAQQSGRDRSGGEDTGAGGSDGSDTAGSGTADESGIREVVGNVASGSDDGMGAALPIILAATLIGAIAFLIVRRSGSRAGRA